MISRPAILATVMVGLVVLGGCGGSPDIAAPVQSSPLEPITEQNVPIVNPFAISIPDINAMSSLVPVGVTDDGGIAVPPTSTPLQAAWFEPGPEPGQVGPAIVVGHVDGGGELGIFHRLRELEVGDLIHVTLMDGRIVMFAVYDTEKAYKNEFPAERVVGYVAYPEIRLITCGGQFVGGATGYDQNTIVYARML